MESDSNYYDNLNYIKLLPNYPYPNNAPFNQIMDINNNKQQSIYSYPAFTEKEKEKNDTNPNEIDNTKNINDLIPKDLMNKMTFISPIYKRNLPKKKTIEEQLVLEKEESFEEENDLSDEEENHEESIDKEDLNQNININMDKNINEKNIFNKIVNSEFESNKEIKNENRKEISKIILNRTFSYVNFSETKNKFKIISFFEKTVKYFKEQLELEYSFHSDFNKSYNYLPKYIKDFKLDFNNNKNNNEIFIDQSLNNESFQNESLNFNVNPNIFFEAKNQTNKQNIDSDIMGVANINNIKETSFNNMAKIPNFSEEKLNTNIKDNKLSLLDIYPNEEQSKILSSEKIKNIKPYFPKKKCNNMSTNNEFMPNNIEQHPQQNNVLNGNLVNQMDKIPEKNTNNNYTNNFNFIYQSNENLQQYYLNNNINNLNNKNNLFFQNDVDTKSIYITPQSIQNNPKMDPNENNNVDNIKKSPYLINPQMFFSKENKNGNIDEQMNNWNKHQISIQNNDKGNINIFPNNSNHSFNQNNFESYNINKNICNQYNYINLIIPNKNIPKEENINKNYNIMPQVNNNYSNIHNLVPNERKLPKEDYLVKMFGRLGWICRQCNNFNFETRNKCNRCHIIKMPKTKEEINKKKEKNKKNKKKVKERKTDWLCLNCNNLNYGFRKKCNRCTIDRKDEFPSIFLEPNQKINGNNNNLILMNNFNRIQSSIINNNMNYYEQNNSNGYINSNMYNCLNDNLNNYQLKNNYNFEENNSREDKIFSNEFSLK